MSHLSAAAVAVSGTLNYEPAGLILLRPSRELQNNSSQAENRELVSRAKHGLLEGFPRYLLKIAGGKKIPLSGEMMGLV